MSERNHKPQVTGASEGQAADAAVAEAEDNGMSLEPKTARSPAVSHVAQQNIPRWRQIEIMRERAQLRKALADLDLEIDEFDELEEEVFGSESENEELYQHGERDAVDEMEFDDESLDGDELDEELDEGLDEEGFDDFEDD